jgi:hypothetical protein
MCEQRQIKKKLIKPVILYRYHNISGQTFIYLFLYINYSFYYLYINLRVLTIYKFLILIHFFFFVILSFIALIKFGIHKNRIDK